MTEEPRWLTDDEQRAWRAYLRANRMLWVALDQQLQRDSGLPHAYYLILVALSECPGRKATMSELATLAGTSPSALSHAVGKLEAQGWVSRCRDTLNGRIVLATLTDEGFAELAAAAPGHVGEVRRMIFDRLAPEQVAQLAEICSAIAGEGPAWP
ncbi:MarR family winged helix-turn-helix transcriptional regulator [Allokutzneria sp. NRRL B-24872]|uniref:MarR family winged helix-turn-helix transcriptional regulator n=1 Tax=Allokutzneria sp. NRRL B-24872 TaxID=1137961 RepID=UPI001AEF5630|nr:MarR family transcriptional regulator [Allokutzneria sp. NRRL B-24872]